MGSPEYLGWGLRHTSPAQAQGVLADEGCRKAGVSGFGNPHSLTMMAGKELHESFLSGR